MNSGRNKFSTEVVNSWMVAAFLAAVWASLPSCSVKSESSQGTPALSAERSFWMGFTPWLFEATLEAKDWTYAEIAANGDLISHHMEEGVPWNEMLLDAPFPANYLQELQDRKGRQLPGQKVLLSINPLNIFRDGLAAYRGESVNMPLPPPWNAYSFDNLLVKTAYLNYAKRMKEFFEPDYLLVGIEVNLLLRNAPDLWNRYVELQKFLYGELKAAHPGLPILVSFDSNPFFPEYSSVDNLDAQLLGLSQLEPHLDTVAFSVHPFLSGLFAEIFPADYFDLLFSRTSKPIAISESSYPAQVWSLPSQPNWVWNGSEPKQDHFVNQMLSVAQQHHSAFVVWFCVRDYDALWYGPLGESGLALPWRDTGLYDENGKERLGLESWREILAMPHSP